MFQRLRPFLLCLILLTTSFASFYSTQPVAAQGPVTAITESSTNVRISPSTRSNIIRQLGSKLQVTLIARNANSSWFKLDGFSNGWVNRSQLKLSTSVAALPVSTESAVNQPTIIPRLRYELRQAQQKGVPGGVDLIGVCYAYGYGNVVNVNNAADGWACTRGNEVWFIDWERVCYDVYGSRYHAVRKDDSAGAWRCER